jgi:arylsulfatase A-like enzyme/Tfp pilus assembly protein PilF
MERRIVKRRTNGRRNRAAWLALLALAAAGCGRADRPNVLLLTMDTTRVDRLGCYGYAEPTSPAIDQLAAEGYVFETAVTTNPITLPAHTSIMTGLYPLAHGVRNNSSYRAREGVTTLAEVLRGEGYETGAVVGAFVLDAQFNLDQGFDFYDDEIERDWSRDEIEKRRENAFGFSERKANLVTFPAIRWLESVGQDPFFLWLHYFDPHEPRNAPEPHQSRFGDLYDSEIAFTDEQIGKVFDTLRRLDLWQDTVVVLVADHGEGLLDHSETSHSLRVFDTTMHVPLIVRSPGRPGGRRVGGLVSVVDVMPTVLELLGIERPPDLQGRSLVPLLDGEPADPDREVYFESLVGRLDHGWGELRGLRTAREKLIHGPKPRYYRIDEDPGEVYDRSAQEPAAVERLTRDLARRMKEWARPEARSAIASLDPEAVGKLVSLGYVGGTHGGVSRSLTDELKLETDREDPHDQGHLFDLYSLATEYIRTDDVERGIRELEGILDTDPEFAAAMTTLGAAYLLKLSQPDRAREVLERSLEVDPDQADAHFYLSQIAFAQGDIEKARRHAEAILVFEGHHFGALFQLGSIFATQGDPRRAVEHFRLAYEISPDNVPNLIALAGSLIELGELEEAEGYLRTALDLQPRAPRVLYLAAVWYLESGDRQRARVFLQRTLAADPGHQRARQLLDKLPVEGGNGSPG